MVRRTCALVLGILWLFTSPALGLPAKFSIATAVSGVSLPMSFVFTPDGRMLVAERAGRVRVVRNGSAQSQAALTLSVLTNGERGLMSVAIDPQFATNGWIYVYYTTTGASPMNRVSRFTMTGDIASVASELVVFEDTASTGGYHNGGWMDIGPDGLLYISTGDGQVPANASNLSNVKGKILRLERSGAVPTSNPFVGTAGARPEIFVYGLRNPFRATFSPDGRLFVGDVGEKGFEEINVASAAGGNNFGWPDSEGVTATPGVTSPIYSYATSPTASITLGAFTTSTVYPAGYQNALFFADFMRDTVSVLREGTAGGAAQVEAFESSRDATVAMRRGPDGYIYFASLFAGAIFRIDCEREPTSPALTLTLQPSSAAPGDQVRVAAQVTPGGFPTSTGLQVSANLSALGGAAQQALHDDGVNGDATAGDGVWSHRLIVGNLASGLAPVTASVTDFEGRSASAQTALTVTAIPPAPPNPPPGEPPPSPPPTLETLASQCDNLFGLKSTPNLLFGGSTADSDGDGSSNQVECAAGSHPRGYFTQFFAEGATGGLFNARLSITNPRPSHASLCALCGSPAHVQLSFLRADGTVIREHMLVPEGTEESLDVAAIPGLEQAEFSISIESDEPIIAERTMSWQDGRGGAHAEHGVEAGATEWYFAEGATHSGFALFYLLANAGHTVAHVSVTYLLPGNQSPLALNYEVGARSRRTIWVNLAHARLAATDVSARIVSDVPIVAERAMYLDAHTGGWSAGHAAAAVRRPSTTWMFAEGATGRYFDTYLLMANPFATPADVTVRYLRPDGLDPIDKTYRIGGQQRVTIDVEREDPGLADTAVSIAVTVEQGTGVVAERAMWWPGPTSATWSEAHVSPGSPAAHTEWGVGGGAVGGGINAETYVLVANTSNRGGIARITLLMDDGTTAAVEVPVPALARVSVPVSRWFPTAIGHQFGATVRAIGADPVALVVERSSYWGSDGHSWTAGTNALGSPALSADVTTSIGPAGFDRILISVPRGGRLRVVNADAVAHFITATACGPIEAIGVLGPGESAVTGTFATSQSCALSDAFAPSAPSLTATLMVP
jgi:glucose/arabinose dehydrogenase